MEAGDYKLACEYLYDGEFHDWAYKKGIGYNVSRFLSDREPQYWLSSEDTFLKSDIKMVNGIKPNEAQLHNLLRVRNHTMQGLSKFYLAYKHNINPHSAVATKLYRDFLE